MAKLREITIKKGIKKSVFKGNSYPQNDFSMSLMEREKTKKPTLYIYHSFDSKSLKKYNRWYDIDFLRSKYKLNDKTRTLTYIIPEWENDVAGEYAVYKNVPIVIHFTVKGWDKFTKTLNDFKEKINGSSKRKRKAPAKKKTTTKKKASPIRKKLAQRKKAPKKSARILRGKRNSPSTSATSVSVGTKRRGGDGKMYVCKTYKRGNKRVKRWFKV